MMSMPIAPNAPDTSAQKKAFMSKAFSQQNVPHDQYEHSHSMINSVMPNEADIQAVLHSQIVDSHVQTGTIGNDDMLLLLQNDLPFLHSALSIAQRNEKTKKAFGPAWTIMFHSWRDSMNLTKTLHGVENREQHATGRPQSPVPYAPGYGNTPPLEQQKKPGIFDRILGKKQQQG